jgi:CpeT protein
MRRMEAKGLGLMVLGAAMLWMGGCSASRDMDDLVTYMTGSFSSAGQAAADPDNYFDIRLEMAPIWTDREDGHWLYVEQAVATALKRPYRQRIYHVHALDDDVYASDVYLLPGDPLEFAGAHEKPSLLDGVTPEDLTLREGCTVYLQRMKDGSYFGQTEVGPCSSSLGEAAYATSEISMTADGLVSWDRGFDESGQQVWGATRGGYIFMKVK